MIMPIDLRVKFNSIQWLKSHGYNLPLATRARAIKAGVLPSREIKGAGDYSTLRDRLWNAVFDAVHDYLAGNGNVTSYLNSMTTAISQAYVETSETAYTDGGGDLPIDEDTASWARSELDAQLNYAESLFQNLKQLRKEEGIDPTAEAFSTADRWGGSLDGFYNAVKIAAAGSKMLTWTLGDTEKHCADCAKLDGQRHRAAWYSSRGYYPRKPGSATECGGWNCDCSLLDDSGEEFTI